MFRIICILIGYILGTLPTAFLLGKKQGIDIREYGSGNSGATNALRVMGKKAGAFVFVIDMLKAAAAFWISGYFFGEYSTAAAVYGGLGAIIGHCFPFYLKFKGGKGVACFVALILSIDPVMGATIIALGLSVLIFTRYVSLTSLTINALTPPFLFLYGFSTEIIITGAAGAMLCFIMHRGNIQRLLAGTESRLGQKS